MLLPTAERRGDIHFYLAKSLPYPTRLAVAFSFFMLGMLVQFVGGPMGIWAGLPIVFVGTLLLLTKGYQNRVIRGAATNEWRPSRREEVARIIEISKRQKKWDMDAVDISNPIGCLCLFALLGAGAFTFFVVSIMGLPGRTMLLSCAILADAAIMLLPFWVTGVRMILRNDALVVKAKLMLGVEDNYTAAGPREGEQFQYQIQTAPVRKKDGEVPSDVKCLVSFPGASSDFLGVQAQIAINNVQGRDFPYFYCVLVAKKEFGMDWERMGPPPAKVILEPSHEGEVDIIVIRQITTKKSGYHTKAPMVSAIFSYALNEARRFLAENG